MKKKEKKLKRKMNEKAERERERENTTKEDSMILMYVTMCIVRLCVIT